MARTVSCPICKRPVALDDPYMPFCSDRCRLIDLGNWASEKYVISSPADPITATDAPEDLDDLDDLEAGTGLLQ